MQNPVTTLTPHWTIWGISLQALAFFLASAIHGGSSWGRGGPVRPLWGETAALGPDFSGAVTSEKAAGVTAALWGGRGLEGEVVTGLGGDEGLVQELGFWGTGTGVGLGRDLWSTGLVVEGGT